MGAIIKKISHYLPEKTLTNQDLQIEFRDWSAAKIESKTGIRERHVAGENETSLDLATKSSNLVLEDYDRDKIDFIILCTQSPDHFLPTTSCILQERLGLSTRTGAFDFNLGCSGYIYGLALAKSLLSSKISRTVLLVTAETYTKFIHPKDKGNRTIFGDGSAATIIEYSDNNNILEFVLGTDGRGARNLIVPNGALRKPTDPEAPEILDDSGGIRTENHLYMNGPEIFNFTIAAVPKLVGEVLQKNHKSLEEMALIIFHQANKFILEYLKKKIGIPESRFYIDMLNVGNTVSSTIPIALKDSLMKGKIKEGDEVLLIGFGVGYSWGGCIIRI
jgi:3-oxoacyl-[acyl-carrier-protein] synthase-3